MTDIQNENDLVIELFSNPDLMREFISNPKKVLKEKGFQVEDDVEYRVVEDTKNIRHIAIPYLEMGTMPENKALEKRKSKVVIGPGFGPTGCTFG
jgi:hypothetical protein